MNQMAVAQILPSQHPKLYQKIANSIAHFIGDGRYTPGQRLPSERDLAEEFEVSRPTIREAMIALEIRGLVETRHGSGVYVTKTKSSAGANRSEAELDIGVFELTEARRLFEGEAAALAATVITDKEIKKLEKYFQKMTDRKAKPEEQERADRQFHVAIAQATQNSAIVAVVENLWDMRYSSLLCRTMIARAAAARIRPVKEEHRDILNALKARDPERARAAMRSHLSQVIEALFRATELDSFEKAKSDVDAKRTAFAKRTSI
jgi:GntR family transcriptional repressor for pyruvate dehydrogenase complex